MNKSETVGKLAAALSKLQGEIQNLHKDKQGYGYKYAELSSVLDVTRPLCAKYELAVAQLCANTLDEYTIEPNTVGVQTMLMHSSGEWIMSNFFMPVTAGKGMSPAQAAGSVITYARRYALAAILGIAQTDNDASIKEIEVEKPKDGVDSGNYTRLLKLITEKKLEDKIDTWCKHFNVPLLIKLTDEQLKQLTTRIEESN